MDMVHKVGISVEEIDTPALLIDLDVMEGNIARMADFFSGVEANLRPHVKTHKSPILAHKQIAAGAIGVTCAKLGEAEVMAENGIRDILIANQIVGAQKVERLVNLTRDADVMVAVDTTENVKELSMAAQRKGATLRVLVEVNVGQNRCGVDPGEPALDLVRQVAKSKGLKFAGLMGYEGHAVSIADVDERTRKARTSMKILTDTASLIKSAGLSVEVVSAGGTGTYNITGTYPGVTEIQAGSYILMDGSYRKIVPFDCALTLLTTVVSARSPERIIVDAGMKSISQDMGMPEIKDQSDLLVTGLSEEHGKLKSTSDASPLKPGDKIELIPSHGCTTVNLHDRYHAVRNGRLEAVWLIGGRGKSQ
jgi:D-serine deaminase-like pyridoxal phosphate-dependent protein